MTYYSYYEFVENTLKIERFEKRADMNEIDIKPNEKNSVIIRTNQINENVNISSSGNQYPYGKVVCSFKIKDSNEFSDSINLDNWLFEDLIVKFDSYSRTIPFFKVTDPKGCVREIEMSRSGFNQSFDKNFYRAFFLFLTMKVFKNLEIYDKYEKLTDSLNKAGFSYSGYGLNSDIANTLKSIIDEYKYFRIAELLDQNRIEPSLKFIFVGNPGSGRMKSMELLNKGFYNLGLTSHNVKPLYFNANEVDKSYNYDGEKRSVLFTKSNFDLAEQNELIYEEIEKILKGSNIIYLFLTPDEFNDLINKNSNLVEKFGRKILFQDLNDHQLFDLVEEMLGNSKYFRNRFIKEDFDEMKQKVLTKNPNLTLRNQHLADAIYYEAIDSIYKGLDDLTYMMEIMK